jgi:hypothetical protein
MPATPERRHSVDLLLCGHHYRVSRQALAAAGARIEDLPGRAGAAEAALLETVDRDHAEVRLRSLSTGAPSSRLILSSRGAPADATSSATCLTTL